jgi:hypothetical protein
MAPHGRANPGFHVRFGLPVLRASQNSSSSIENEVNLLGDELFGVARSSTRQTHFRIPRKKTMPLQIQR